MPSLVVAKFGQRTDKIQNVILQLLTSQFFPWMCVVLILSRNRWKKLIILLLVAHWFIRAVGDMFVNTLETQEPSIDNWPFGNKQWIKSYGIASIFWHMGEIFGDWYLLIRTKAICKNKRYIRWIFITCGFYNIVKCAQIYTFFSYVPFREGYDMDEEKWRMYTLDMAENKFMKWSNVAFQQLCSLAYDISVIVALKKSVFNNKESLSILDSHGFSFLKRFKQISEYRIYLSIIITISGIPFIFMYSIIVIYYRYQSISYKDQAKVDAVGRFTDDQSIDAIRVMVLNFNYVFMYIDQILLRYYVDKQQSMTKGSSGFSNSNPNIVRQNSKPTYNFNMVYHDRMNYEDFEAKKTGTTKRNVGNNQHILDVKPKYYDVVFNTNNSFMKDNSLIKENNNNYIRQNNNNIMRENSSIMKDSEKYYLNLQNFNSSNNNYVFKYK